MRSVAIMLILGSTIPVGALAALSSAVTPPEAAPKAATPPPPIEVFATAAGVEVRGQGFRATGRRVLFDRTSSVLTVEGSVERRATAAVEQRAGAEATMAAPVIRIELVDNAVTLIDRPPAGTPR